MHPLGRLWQDVIAEQQKAANLEMIPFQGWQLLFKQIFLITQ